MFKSNYPETPHNLETTNQRPPPQPYQTPLHLIKAARSNYSGPIDMQIWRTNENFQRSMKQPSFENGESIYRYRNLYLELFLSSALARSVAYGEGVGCMEVSGCYIGLYDVTDRCRCKSPGSARDGWVGRTAETMRWGWN